MPSSCRCPRGVNGGCSSQACQGVQRAACTAAGDTGPCCPRWDMGAMLHPQGGGTSPAPRFRATNARTKAWSRVLPSNRVPNPSCPAQGKGTVSQAWVPSMAGCGPVDQWHRACTARPVRQPAPRPAALLSREPRDTEALMKGHKAASGSRGNFHEIRGKIFSSCGRSSSNPCN